MTDFNNDLNAFKQFAAAGLQIHLDELRTRYNDEEIDNDTREKGYTQFENIRTGAKLKGKRSFSTQEKSVAKRRTKPLRKKFYQPAISKSFLIKNKL